MVSLYNLKREYEERREALIEQLKRNPDMEPAEQHQIYGAVKEIEHFIRAVESHISSSQEQQSIDLANDRPRPLIDRTRRIAEGTKSIFTKRIPNTARRIASVPRAYIDKRRERRALREQVEREVLARMQQSAAQAGELPVAMHEEVRAPEEVFPPMQDRLEAEFSSTTGTPGDDIEEARDRMPKKVPERMRRSAPKRRPAKKGVKGSKRKR